MIITAASIVGAAIASICSKHFTSVAIKLVASIIAIAFVVVLGYIIDDDMIWIEVQNFFFATGIITYFTSNNSFTMSAATADIRGMIGGCV